MFLKPTASVQSTVHPESVPEVGVPRTGVTRVGEVANTLSPVPVFATDTRFLDASVATAFDAVSQDTLTPETLNIPVDGLNCSLVDDTFAVVMLPVEALVKVR